MEQRLKMKIDFVGRLFNNTYYVNPHCHEYWEIVYYTHGSGDVNINETIVPFEEHDIFAIPPGIPHFDYSDKGFRNYHYNFTDEEFTYRSYLKIKDSENNAFLGILTQMYNEYHLKRDHYERIVDSLYDVLRNYLYSFANQTAENPYVMQVVNAVIDNISNPGYDVNDELTKIPLNIDYFRKIFINETGKTPLQLLTFKRMMYAKQLLRFRQESKLSIKEIAWMAGYADYYYFSRVFKQQFGSSPRIWVNRTE
jgi:AraC-like DNA-binding protein